MQSKFTRLSPQRMADLVARHDYSDMRVYSDRNPIVRELFWRRLEALLSISQPPARDRVLDFGGGNGVLALTLSRRYGEYVAVDLRNSMVKEIADTEGLTNVRALNGDLASLGLPEASFDTIVASDVLEHIVDLPSLTSEFQRLLKPGGELLVSAPSENRLYELGRRVFSYTKVHDHYHDASYVERTVSARLPRTRRRYFPLNVQAIAVFMLARFARDKVAGQFRYGR